MNITIGEEELKILKKRAKKNFMSLKEQVEDIVRRSCVNYKTSGSNESSRSDDALVDIFSRQKRGKRK